MSQVTKEKWKIYTQTKKTHKIDFYLKFSYIVLIWIIKFYNKLIPALWHKCQIAKFFIFKFNVKHSHENDKHKMTF